MKILFLVNMEDIGFEEPLGVLYLSALCKHEGHQVYVSENKFSRLEHMIKEIKPDLLGVRMLTARRSGLISFIICSSRLNLFSETYTWWPSCLHNAER